MMIGLEQLHYSLNDKWRCKLKYIFWVWHQLQQMSNDDKNYAINIWFLSFVLTLDVVIEGNILKWTITYNNLAHFIDHDGSKTISSSTSFSTFYKFLMVSTIICLYFFSTYHSCGPLPFKGSYSLKVISLGAMFYSSWLLPSPCWQ
jgi:hypothetical protein